MNNIRPIAYVLASTNHGSMIVNRNDYCTQGERGFGVGFQLLTQSSFDPSEIELLLALLQERRKHYGNGVIAIDGGANIGVHTVEWAKTMYGWGDVYSFEAQEKIYYALAGNIALNNCFNVTARNQALGLEMGSISIPQPDYHSPASYGSLELIESPNNENIGQPINRAQLREVELVTIDSLNLSRIDLIKLDVEGMEVDVLYGAKKSIAAYKPILYIETMKSDLNLIEIFLHQHRYKTFPMGLNTLAIHLDDLTLGSIVIK